MIKKLLIKFMVILFIMSAIGLPSLVLASPPAYDLTKIANEMINKMEYAYQTENVQMFTSFFDIPLVVVDITKNKNELYSADQLKQEAIMFFNTYSELKAKFIDRQITFIDDTIMVRATRYTGAKEVPVLLKNDVLLIIKKPFTHRNPWSAYEVVNRTTLTEEYVPITPDIMSIFNTSSDNIDSSKHHTKKYSFDW